MISCLMVTQDFKFEVTKNAINCFVKQTYPDKELVIVHDSSDEFHQQLIQWLAQFPDHHFRPVFVNDKLSLGELRNISVDNAEFPVICQWDDDDLYHPQRLEIQFEKMNKENSDFCFFTDQLHWFTEKNLLFWDDWNLETWPMNLIQGTVMGYKEKLGRYPSLGKGEDTPVIVDIAKRQCKISVLENQGYLYIYTFNGGNVWDINHHAAIAQWKRFRKDRLLQYRDKLEKYLPEYSLPFDKFTMPHDDGVIEIDLTGGSMVDNK